MTFYKAALTTHKVARRFLFSLNPLDKITAPLFTFCITLDNVVMTIGKVTMTFHTSLLTLFTFYNPLDTFRMTIFNSCVTLDNSSITKTKIQATHKKITLLQAATGYPTGKACKREIFSATQPNSIFFLARLRVLNFSPTRPLT